VTSFARQLGLLLLSAVTWCVPLFVMISGALWLGRPAEPTAGAFYRRRLLKPGPPIVFWSLFYWCWRVWFRGQDVPPDAFALSVLAGRPYAHLYFLFVIVGLYLITPFLQVFLQAADRRQVRSVVVLALGLAAAQQLLGLVDLSANSNIVTYFVPFTGYYLAGYWLRDVVLDRRRQLLAGAMFVVIVALTFGGSELTGRIFGRGESLAPQGYMSFLTISATLLVFLLVRSSLGVERFPRGSPTWLATVATATFGVYLVHPAVLGPLRIAAEIGMGRWRNLVVFPLSVLVVGAVSLGLVLVIQRIPVARRIVP
jgi:surface polysaccharide O-acyltransferase-like enzyme